MANIKGVSRPNWNDDVPPRTLDAACATESGSGGKLNGGIPLAAPVRMKPRANRQIRRRTPYKGIAERFTERFVQHCDTPATSGTHTSSGYQT